MMFADYGRWRQRGCRQLNGLREKTASQREWPHPSLSASIGQHSFLMWVPLGPWHSANGRQANRLEPPSSSDSGGKEACGQIFRASHTAGNSRRYVTTPKSVPLCYSVENWRIHMGTIGRVAIYGECHDSSKMGIEIDLLKPCAAIKRNLHSNATSYNICH